MSDEDEVVELGDMDDTDELGDGVTLLVAVELGIGDVVNITDVALGVTLLAVAAVVTVSGVVFVLFFKMLVVVAWACLLFKLMVFPLEEAAVDVTMGSFLPLLAPF